MTEGGVPQASHLYDNRKLGHCCDWVYNRRAPQCLWTPGVATRAGSSPWQLKCSIPSPFWQLPGRALCLALGSDVVRLRGIRLFRLWRRWHLSGLQRGEMMRNLSRLTHAANRTEHGERRVDRRKRPKRAEPGCRRKVEALLNGDHTGPCYLHATDEEKQYYLTS